MPLKPDSKTGLRRQIVQLETRYNSLNDLNETLTAAKDHALERLDASESDLSAARFTIKWLKQEKQTLLIMVRELTGMVK